MANALRVLSVRRMCQCHTQYHAGKLGKHTIYSSLFHFEGVQMRARMPFWRVEIARITAEVTSESVIRC